MAKSNLSLFLRPQCSLLCDLCVKPWVSSFDHGREKSIGPMFGRKSPKEAVRADNAVRSSLTPASRPRGRRADRQFEMRLPILQHFSHDEFVFLRLERQVEYTRRPCGANVGARSQQGAWRSCRSRRSSAWSFQRISGCRASVPVPEQGTSTRMRSNGRSNKRLRSVENNCLHVSNAGAFESLLHRAHAIRVKIAATRGPADRPLVQGARSCRRVPRIGQAQDCRDQPPQGAPRPAKPHPGSPPSLARTASLRTDFLLRIPRRRAAIVPAGRGSPPALETSSNLGSLRVEQEPPKEQGRDCLPGAGSASALRQTSNPTLDHPGRMRILNSKAVRMRSSSGKVARAHRPRIVGNGSLATLRRIAFTRFAADRFRARFTSSTDSWTAACAGTRSKNKS